MPLQDLGWDPFFEQHFIPFAAKNCYPGRVCREHKHLFGVLCETGEILAEISGKMRYFAETRNDYPAIGDWVALQPLPGERRAIIQGVLPRKTCFSRKMKQEYTEPQILAANIDTVFLVSALNEDFNVRRIERYLLLTYESRALPVIILNKCDLTEEWAERVLEVEAVANGAPVYPISALTGVGLDFLASYLLKGKTVSLLGSSGVGKSTLINALFGSQRQKINDVREIDGRGRHTTSFRELIVLPNGSIVIDTPGLRKVELWANEEQLENSFKDIELLAQQCRFGDCQHRTEPGCAVRRALEHEELDEGRYRNYCKLQREIRYLDFKQNQKIHLLEKAKWKRLAAQKRKSDKRHPSL